VVDRPQTLLVGVALVVADVVAVDTELVELPRQLVGVGLR